MPAGTFVVDEKEGVTPAPTLRRENPEMIDGTYDVRLKTPMGIKQGRLDLRDEGGALVGAMHIMGSTTRIGSGSTEGDNFGFAGELKTAVGRLAYECQGTVNGNSIEGVVSTRKGTFPLSGARH